MQIIYSHKGKEKVFDTKKVEAVIGRPEKGRAVNLDLTPDTMVSRPHARVWLENGQCWIEDLNSARGTQVNGEEIKSKGRRQLQPGDAIRIGETTLRVEIPIPTALKDSYATKKDPYGTRPDLSVANSIEDATQLLDASIPVFVSATDDLTVTERRLALLYELPLQFGQETRLDALLRLIVERLVDVIPNAMRGSLLIKDRQTEELLLKASLPADKPAVSMTLARQAMEQRKAFVWPPATDSPQGDQDATPPIPPSAAEYCIESAMYAPLLWNDAALGVICVDNSETSPAFDADDLRLLLAVAHHAAMAVANRQLQEDLRREAERLANSLKLVSPQIAERLKQHRGRIRLGGEFHDATILFSDIRGFTKLSATMSPDDVTGMLDDYFSRLVPIVFKHHGEIDKFVGDAILAVFGSPDPDWDQHTHSIRAALEMQEAMREVNGERAAKGKTTGELGVGIHCGEVVHGFIGSAERMEFTVIGDTVNRSSRYCDGARGGEVLISPEVYQRVFRTVEVEQTTIPTKHEGNLTAYRIKRIK